MLRAKTFWTDWAVQAQQGIRRKMLHFFMPGLSLVFVAAKLFGAIDWAWIWVLSPVWGLVLLYMVLFAVIGFAKMASMK